jgi:hypothetical protein
MREQHERAGFHDADPAFMELQLCDEFCTRFSRKTADLMREQATELTGRYG